MATARKPKGESGHNRVDNARLYSLCTKNEWALVDITLRNCPLEYIMYKDEKSGDSPLVLTVRQNKATLIEKLLDAGAPINDRLKDGRTVLHIAAQTGREDTLRILVARNADGTITGGLKQNLPMHIACGRPTGAYHFMKALIPVSGKDWRLAVDKDGRIPLMYAIEALNGSAVREILWEQAAEQLKHKNKEGDAALHICARRCSPEIMNMLLEAKASPDAQNTAGLTALHICAKEGDEASLRILYNFNANPDILDNQDRTPLHISAEIGNTRIVEFLVDKFKANVMARTKDGNTLMHIASVCGFPETTLTFLRKGVPMNMPNKSGALCLHSAAKCGHTNVLKTLLELGQNPDMRTKDNYTALHVAIEHGRPEAVQVLLGFGAKIEFKGGKAKETPLHVAARVKDGEKCAEMLIKSGADVNSLMENGESALHIAARYGNLKLINLLLEDTSSSTVQSKNGETPLHIAVRYCHFTIAEKLITNAYHQQSKAAAVSYVNTADCEGETVMHYACEIKKSQLHYEFEDIDLVKLLVKYDADITVHTKYTQETPIHYCARTGNADVLMELVQRLDHSVLRVINKPAKNSWTPIMFAAEGGHAEIVRILLRRYARIDVFDDQGYSPLHLACRSGHIAVASLLLQSRAFVNARSKNSLTPLHCAAQAGHVELVEMLIRNHGAIIDALSLKNDTPLHLAAQNGRMKVCQLLLDLGANPNVTDANGRTPRHLAAENNHADVVRLFLIHQEAAGLKGNLEDKNHMNMAHIAAEGGCIKVIEELMKFDASMLLAKGTGGHTPLHLAAAGGHADVARLLVNSGVSTTVESQEGLTPLMLAAKHGHVNILEILKANSAAASSKTGFTALHYAAKYAQVEFVRELLTYMNGDIDARPSKRSPIYNEIAGFSPLHCAAEAGDEATVRILLNSGVTVDSSTKVTKQIPLHIAAVSGSLPVASLLLSRSTDQVKAQDSFKRNALHHAAAHGWLDLVTLLISQGSDVNVLDQNGHSPLHLAVKKGHLGTIRVLIDSGANTKAEDVKEKTPLYYACESGHEEVVEYLLEKDHDSYELVEDSSFLSYLVDCSRRTCGKSMVDFIIHSPAPVDIAAKLSMKYDEMSFNGSFKQFTRASEFCATVCKYLLIMACTSTEERSDASKAERSHIQREKVPDLATDVLTATDPTGSPLIDVLIACKQLKVIEHDIVQRYLNDVWCGGHQWNSSTMTWVTLLFLVFPPVWFIYSLPIKIPYSNVPMIKFIKYFVSHAYMLILFIIMGYDPQMPIFKQAQNLSPSWSQALLAVWLSGYMVSELVNPSYITGFGLLKKIVLAFGCAGVFTFLISYVYAGYDSDMVAYLLLLCQLFLSFSNFAALFLVIDFMTVLETFGPWIIILSSLWDDVVRYMVLFAIFLTGFTLSTSTLFMYAYPNPSDPNDMTMRSMEIVDIFINLYLGVLVPWTPEFWPTIERTPVYLTGFTFCFYALFLILLMLILSKLFVAMITDTFEKVNPVAESEWKFLRTRFIRDVVKTSISPPPIILIEQASSVVIDFVKSMCPSHGLSAKQKTLLTTGARKLLETQSPQLRRNSDVPNFLDSVEEQRVQTIATVVDWRSLRRRFNTKHHHRLLKKWQQLYKVLLSEQDND